MSQCTDELFRVNSLNNKCTIRILSSDGCLCLIGC